ncbi:MAG: hypothetical protein HFJ10_10015 [Lachnospiraceae bacterium]|jgi:cell division protein ZapA|nr:hypothetical protein [Lachnospiraceae bacterium]
MAMKNVVEVVIAGKVYKVSGFESSEYLHQVSVYINEKLAEFQKIEGYRKQNTDQKQLMLNMNLADDFFKAKRQADKLSVELEQKEREMYGIRHDLVDARLSLEKQEHQKHDWEEQLKEQKKEYEEKLKEQKRESEEKLKSQKNEISQKLEKLEIQKNESAERLEHQKKNFEKERQDMKRTIESLKKALENQKRMLEEQRQATQKKLEEQNQAAQKRLSEQKRNYDSEMERLQKELQGLQRRFKHA